MSKNTYTAGPWVWDDHGNVLRTQGSSYASKPGGFVLWFGGHGDIGGLEEGSEGEANAKIIAAAPTMLELLRDSDLRLHDDCEEHGGCLCSQCVWRREVASFLADMPNR